VILRTIRARLTLWYTSLLTLSFLALGGTGYGLLAYTLSQESDAALRGCPNPGRTDRGGGNFHPRTDEVFRRFLASPSGYFERLPPDLLFPGETAPGEQA
jgi:hypothetical protein